MADTTKECKAKVFVSCGQLPDSEHGTATRIEQKLKEMLFEVYVAKNAQNLGGVDEIMRQLKSSEYFLFVDFFRPASCPPFSLFSHQELAVAYDRGIEAKFLQEDNAEGQGIAKYLFTNPQRFNDRDNLPDLVGSLCKEWNPKWKNALTVMEPEPDPDDVPIWQPYQGRTYSCQARFFHIPVKNLHKQRVARRCVVYLKSVTGGDGELVGAEWPIEHKWDGFMFPEASIRPQGIRRFDAFYVISMVEDFPSAPAIRKQTWSPFAPANTTTVPVTPENLGEPPSSSKTCAPDVRGKAYFNTLTDCLAYQQPLPTGDYKFTYEILAEGFPTTEAVFDVHIGNGAEDTTSKLVEQSHHYT